MRRITVKNAGQWKTVEGVATNVAVNASKIAGVYIVDTLVASNFAVAVLMREKNVIYADFLSVRYAVLLYAAVATRDIAEVAVAATKQPAVTSAPNFSCIVEGTVGLNLSDKDKLSFEMTRLCFLCITFYLSPLFQKHRGYCAACCWGCATCR